MVYLEYSGHVRKCQGQLHAVHIGLEVEWVLAWSQDMPEHAVPRADSVASAKSRELMLLECLPQCMWGVFLPLKVAASNL
eukprot:3593660-Amphidinium_carterae.1